MLLGQVFERFANKTPFAVMSRSLLERTLTPEALDALFDNKADCQYTRELTFSSVVDLMGLVVTSARTTSSTLSTSGVRIPISASGAAGASGPGADTGSAGQHAPKDDVLDAEFEEVKDSDRKKA